jgi:NAD+ synthase (glutamine-hydrolysing)
MKLALHQTHDTIGDFKSLYHKVEMALKLEVPGPQIDIFPELFLWGYPLKDLCLQKSSYSDYLAHLDRINQLSTSLPSNINKLLLLGGLHYDFDNSSNDESVPQKIENVIYKLVPGLPLEKVYTKQLLPNYDIFDEKKYFAKGDNSTVLEFDGSQIGLLICEDMWHSSAHKVDPVKSFYNHLKEKKSSVDLMINMSASPFHCGKFEKRLARAKTISKIFNCPFVYVNRVGGEAEILFDGRSFMVSGEEVLEELPPYKTESKIVDFAPSSSGKNELRAFDDNQVENTWEGLYSPRLEKSHTPAQLSSMDDKTCQEVLDSLCFGITEYTKKSHLKKIVVALSGGIDSSLVLAIAKLACPENFEIEAIYMPGLYSSGQSFDLSVELCENLGIKLHYLPIKFPHKNMANTFKETFGTPLEGIADENIQSRLRGLLLLARSNQTGALVLNTSNKSELAVGYSTLYGDSVGGISVLGDLYKSEVFELARYINKIHNSLIPEGIITRPPSAELREDQADSDSLPAYEVLDPILEGLLSYRYSKKDLIELGHSEENVEHIYQLFNKAEYKRYQFCPIIKLWAKSFGFGHRQPLTKLF